MKNLKLLVQWMADHPLKSNAFSSFFTFTACVIAGCPGSPVPVIAFVVGLAVFAFVLWRDRPKKMIAVLLAFGILMAGFPTSADEPPKDEPQPAGYVITGIVVIVVGTVVFYYLYRTCQRLFNRPPPPPATNNPPIAVWGAAPDGAADSFAATRTFYYFVSCDVPVGGIVAAGAPETQPTAMELTGSFEQTTNGLQFRLTPRKLDAAQDLVGPVEFGQLLAQHGVRIGNGIDQLSFGRNGRPSTQADVPIYFSTDDNGRGSFSVGRTGELQTVVMERSPDLKRWEELTTARISAGQQLRFLDATAANQMFYRFRPL